MAKAGSSFFASFRFCLTALLLLSGPAIASPQQEDGEHANPAKDEVATDETPAGKPIATDTEDDIPFAGNNRASESEITRPSDKKPSAVKKNAKDLKSKIANAYKDPFYQNDFSYLADPEYKGNNLGEGLKQLSLGDQGKLDIGGQYRLRYHNEHNMRGFGLTGRDDQFLLDRTRVYADYKINKRARVFAEFLDAGSSHENFAPRINEVQRFDAQNLFADLALVDSDLGKLTLRAGRQELLFGSQRLIAPLDWANNRRRFDGTRFIWDSENGTTDFLLFRPENINFTQFDSPNQNQALWGVYHTDKSLENGTIDTYYLGFEDTSVNLHVHTLGTAFKGEVDGMLWDEEFGYQLGKNSDGSDISAYSLTFGLGAKSSGTMKPTLWLYYDWASGDDSVNNGWNHLFPLGHKYLGYMDLFGRRNIHDLNSILTFNPTEKFSVLAWYHYFCLANGAQGPYNVTNTPFNAGGTVGSRDLGHEIDLLGTYKVNARSNLVLGYSHFFTGKYYDNSLTSTGAALFIGDGDFFYTQWHYNF